MRDFSELRAVVIEAYGATHAGGESLAVTVDEIAFKVEPGIAFEEPWLVVTAPIVAEEELARPRDALELNALLSVGALAIAEGALVLRWAWPIHPLDRPALDRYLRFLARETRRLRDIHRHLRRPQSAVDFLAD